MHQEVLKTDYQEWEENTWKVIPIAKRTAIIIEIRASSIGKRPTNEIIIEHTSIKGNKDL